MTTCRVLNSNSGLGNAGGVVGWINAAGNTVNAINNANSSVVVNGGTHVGGIVGRLNTGTLTNSTSSGAITGVTNTGGMVGRLYSVHSRAPAPPAWSPAQAATRVVWWAIWNMALQP